MRFPTRLTSWLTPPAKARRRNRAHRNHLHLEALESRVVPAILPAPNPIFPIHGEVNLLSVIQNLADKQNLNAQDHFPVPYTIVVSAGGAAPTVKNWKAGAPVRLDADQSLATGKGGHDIQLEVNTDKYVNGLGETDWRMRLNVNRIDSGSHAQNLSVVIAFPFDAFNEEALPGAPNILMGFQTRLPGTPGQQDYVTGIDGGVAPATMQMVLTPHVLAGTTHDFEWTVDTTGAANPITFLSGEFDGDPGSNSILNALGWSAYVQNVPAHIGAEIKVAENAIGSAAADSKMDLHWTASSRSLTAFGYVEAESAGAASSPTTANYVTAIVAEQMPTDERFILHHNEAAGTLTLDHTANAGTTEMTFLKRRSDGLALTGVAADDTLGVEAVPAGVDLTLGLRGYMSLDVSANTLDLHVQATQTGGFNNTAQFFEQYNLDYAALRVKNAPDLTADLDPVEKRFVQLVTHVGEVAPFTELVIDDNGRISATNVPLNLELPEHYASSPPWHLWSIVDDGTHGTAVARALDVTRILGGLFAGSATFDHNAPEIMETVELQTVAAHPMQTFLKSGLLSAVQPPVPPGETEPDPFIEVTGHIEDVPVGRTWVRLDFPLTADWESETKIGEICMAGHIGTLHFGLILEDNPVNGSFDFRPEGSLRVIGEDAGGNPDFFTGNAAIVYDVTGFDPAVLPWPEDYALDGFHSKNETFFPGNTPLKEARLRLDHVPSLRATWHDEDDHTFIDIDTDEATGPHAYVGGVQLQISTKTTLAGTTFTCDNIKDFIPPAATDASTHYGLLKDVAGEQTLKFGVFGVNSFHFRTDDAGPAPSLFELNYELDPTRTLTAGRVEVDSNPTSTGALGTYFGGDDVVGDLDISYVPSSLWLQSDLDPTLCTKGLFPLPGSDINLDFNVAGTDIFIHVSDLPANFCLGFDVTGATSVLTIESTNLAGTQVVKTGLVEILFQNTTAGLDGGVLFGPANPIQELRLRMDDVPSLAISWATTGANTFFSVDTSKADVPATVGIREDILGSLRFNASVAAGPATVPTYPVPTGTEDHFFRLIDTASDRRFEGGVFGLDKFEVLSLTATDQLQVTYVGNVNRDLTVQVQATDGQFFPGHDVDAALLIDSLPQKFALTASMDGTAVSYDASAGISQIRIGGPDVIGQPGALKGKYDKLGGDPSDIRFNIDMNGMPAKFAYALDPDGGVSITAQTAGGSPSDIDSIIARVEDNGGFAGSAGLLGAAIKDVRLRLDDVPTMSATWSTAAGTKIDFSTAAAAGAFQFLGGAQVILSTDQSTSPFLAPTADSKQRVAYLDEGGAGKKQLTAQVFGLDEFHLQSTDGPPRDLTVSYAADAARQLEIDVDAAFGNKFFPSYDADVTLTVNSVPQTWNLATDLATNLHYLGSGGIAVLSVLGTIDDTNDAAANGTDVTFIALGLPSKVDFVVVPNTSATLTMNAGVDLVTLELKSTGKIFGSDYQLIQATLDDIPAQWSANWAGGQFVLESKDAGGNPSPMGFVSGLVSTSSNAATNTARIDPFRLDGPVQGGAVLGGTAGGSRVNYSEFLQEIDRRYYDASGAPSVFARLRDLYAGSEQLDVGEDHAVASIQGGKLEIASFKFSGFQKVAYQPNANGGHYEFKAPVAGLHPLFAGARLDDKAVTVQIGNVPDSLTLDIDTAAGNIHFFTSDDVNASAGQIDGYYGKLPMASDDDTAVRFVMNNTPSDVLITWGFGFPSGSANMTASNLFELLFLAQDGGNRLVGGLSLKELQVGYNIGILTFDTAETLDIEVPVPCFDIPPICFETLFSVPVAWDLLRATAGIDNDTDGPAIGANFAKPGVSGFFNLYDRISGPQGLDPVGPAPGGQEYVPLLTFMMKDFRELSVSAALTLDPITPNLIFPISFVVDITIHGDFVVDVWSSDDTEEFFTVPLIDYDIGFLNNPDYTENSPFHIIPIVDVLGGLGIDHDAVITYSGAHGYGHHFDPFGAMTVLVPPAGSPSAAPLTAADLAPVVAEAITRWDQAGASDDLLDVLRRVRVEVADLPYQTLATYEPGLIRIDVDAAGWGWFIDATPWADEEFGPNGDGSAEGRMDLLTVLMHEMGHLIGFDHHDDDEHGAMSATLLPGARLLEAGADHDYTNLVRTYAEPDADPSAEPSELTARQTATGPLEELEAGSPRLLSDDGVRPSAGSTPLADVETPDIEGATGGLLADGRSLVWSPSAVSGTVSVPALLERNKKTAVPVADQTWDDLFGQPISASGARDELVASYAQRPPDAWLEDEMTLVWVG